MTREEFLIFADDLENKSKKINDNWCICGNRNEKYSEYLVKRERRKLNPCNILVSNELLDQDEELQNDASAAEHGNSLVYDFEYHVVYNSSYMVPILCFNASKLDGSMLTLEEAWHIFNLKDFEGDSPYGILTQMDHPILQRPFLTIHPCQTRQLLENLPNSTNPIISFISSLGSYIGLRSKLDYGKT